MVAVRELRTALNNAKLGHVLTDTELEAVLKDSRECLPDAGRGELTDTARARALEIARELAAEEEADT